MTAHSRRLLSGIALALSGLNSDCLWSRPLHDPTTAIVGVVRAMPVDSICSSRCSVVLMDPDVRDTPWGRQGDRPGHVVTRLRLDMQSQLSQGRVTVLLQARDPRHLEPDSAAYKVSIRLFGDSARVYVEVFGQHPTRRLPWYVMGQGAARWENGRWVTRFSGLIEP